MLATLKAWKVEDFNLNFANYDVKSVYDTVPYCVHDHVKEQRPGHGSKNGDRARGLQVEKLTSLPWQAFVQPVSAMRKLSS